MRGEYLRAIRWKPWYFSLESFYINHTEEFITQSFWVKGRGLLRFDKADYQRHKFGLIPKVGMFLNLSERLGINVYTGVGVRYRYNDYSNFENLREETFLDDEHFSPYYRNEGKNIGVEFSLGVKLFYQLGKKTEPSS